MVSRTAVAHAIMLFERANLLTARDGGVDAWFLALSSAHDGRPGRGLKPVTIADDELLAAARVLAGSASDTSQWVSPCRLVSTVLRLRDGDAPALRRERVQAFVARYGRLVPDDARLADNPRLEIAWRNALFDAVGAGADRDAAVRAAYDAVGLTPPVEASPQSDALPGGE